jgi:hypothetical protein
MDSRSRFLHYLRGVMEGRIRLREPGQRKNPATYQGFQGQKIYLIYG